MKQKSVGLTLRAFIIALALILVAGSPALPPFDGVAYAQTGPSLTAAVTPDGASVSLSWSAVDDADNYQVWRSTGCADSSVWDTSPLATVGGDVLRYSVTAVTAGSSYAYAVRAIIGGTNQGWSNVPCVTIPGGVPKPTAKPTVTLTASGLTAIDVSWTAVSGATSYEVWGWYSGLSGWQPLATDVTGTTYTHTGLTGGTAYYYIVRGTNTSGQGPWSDYALHTLIATTTVPELSLEHVSRTTVRLTWTPATGAANYDLQRRKQTTDSASTPATDKGTWARLPSDLLSGSTTTYTDSAAVFDPGGSGDDAHTDTTYVYRVQALDSNGIAGIWSDEKSVSIPATSQRPGVPGSPSASAVSHSSISVSWTAVDGADYYQVRSKKGTGSYESPTRVDGKTSFEHTDLSPSTKYTYQVRAVNINGPGDWSGAKSATTRPTTSIEGQMPKVSGLTVTDESTYGTTDTLKIKLTWTAVGGATDYDIQRFVSSVGTWVNPENVDGLTSGRLTKDEAGSPPTWEDTSTALARGMTYYYVVSAVDNGPDATDDDGSAPTDTTRADDEMGEWSDYMSVTLKDFKPGAPTSLQATATSGTSIWVSWTEPAHRASVTPVTPVATAGIPTSYGLEWREEGTNAAWTYVLVSGGATQHHLTGLSANKKYIIRVRAENSGGESAWTRLASPVVLGSVLSPPTGLEAVDASSNGGSDTDPTDDVYKIKLSWTAVAGATGYEIERLVSGNWQTPDTNAAANNVVQTGTEFTDDNDIDGTADSDGDLAPSTTYLYRVRTVDRTFTSPWSPVLRGTTRPAFENTAPVWTLTATGMSMIRVSWQAKDGATGYELEMIEGARTADNWNSGIGQTKVTLAGTDRHYVHRSLKAGTQYTYRLRAVYAEDVYSAWTTLTAQYTKPAKPELTTSSATTSTITLKWDAVSWGSGHLTTGATNYQIQRREDGTSEWTTLDLSSTSGGQAATCTNNKCTFIDGNTDATMTDALKKSTRYWYRIRATTTVSNVAYISYWDYENQTTPAK